MVTLPVKNLAPRLFLLINPQFAPWKKQDKILLGWLFSSLTPGVLHQVHRLTTSKEVWSSLESMFASKSDAHTHHLICEHI